MKEYVSNFEKFKLMEQGSNLPPGAEHDPDAPWNQPKKPKVKEPKTSEWTLVSADKNNEFVILEKDKEVYLLYGELLTDDQIQDIAIDYMGEYTEETEEDEDGKYTSKESDITTSRALTADAIVQWVNNEWQYSAFRKEVLSPDVGVSGWEDGYLITKMDKELWDDLLDININYGDGTFNDLDPNTWSNIKQ